MKWTVWGDSSTSTKRRVFQLGIVLVLALFFRGYHLSELIPKHPLLTADGVEYREYGLHLVQPDYPRPLADRPPGFPLLLGVMYSLIDVPADLAYPQRLLTTFFDLAVIALGFFVAAQVGGGLAGVVCGLLLALNGEIIRASALAGTEQFYSAMQLLLFLLYVRLGREFKPQLYALVCLVGAWMVVTKQEGWFILAVYIAYYTVLLFRESGLSWRPLVKLVPLFIAPGMAFAGYKYYSGTVLAIPMMNYRSGNVLFFCEFLAKRMPWGYMRDLRNEYFQINNLDWLLHYHSFGQIVDIVIDSSILVVRFLGAMLGGWLMLPLAACGMLLLVWRRDYLIPALTVVSILPFCSFAVYHSVTSYTPRLLIPSLALVVICTAIGIQWASEQLRRRVAFPTWMGNVLVVVVIAVYAGANLLRENALGVFPAVGGISFKGESQSTFRPPFDLDKKIALATGLQVAGQYDQSRAVGQQVLDHVPGYAPAYVVLALNDLAEGQVGPAVVSLKKALQIVPYYAEAYAILASVQLKGGQYEEALQTCGQCVEKRPDYPPCHFLLGNLKLDYLRDYRAALALYQHYGQLNRQAHRNYQDFLAKRLDKSPASGEIREQISQIDRYLETDIGSFLTPIAWSYLHMGKAGALTQRIKPDDRTLHFNMALAYEQLKDGEKAIEYYEKALRMNPSAGVVRGRVEALKKNDGRVSEEQWSKLAMAPAIYQPDLLFDQAIKGYLDPQYHSVHGDADK